jgi:GntR family transcriptional regulator
VPWTPRTISHDGPDLIWRQIRDDIADAIQRGDLAPGARLPSEMDLANTYAVARVSVRRAVLELRKEKMLVVHQGRGTYVTPKRRA